MNRRLTLATTVLVAGAVIVGTAGCGNDSTPATTTVETPAPPPTTTQAPVTVTEPNQNDDDQDRNDDDQDRNDDDQDRNDDDQDRNDDDRDRGEAVGRAEEKAGLSKARKECLANAPSAADCANIP